MKNLSTLTGSLGTVKYWWFAFNWTILSETPDLNKKISTIYILCTVPISSSPTSAAHLAAWCWINSCKLSNWCSPAAIYLSYPRTKVGGFLANMVALNRSPTRSCIDLTNTFWCPNHITKQNLHVHWWRRISICKVTSVFIPLKLYYFHRKIVRDPTVGQTVIEMGTICVVCPLAIWYEHVWCDI